MGGAVTYRSPLTPSNGTESPTPLTAGTEQKTPFVNGTLKAKEQGQNLNSNNVVRVPNRQTKP